MLALLSQTPADAYAQDKDYYVKAAFLYKFIKFVEWPGDKNIASQNAIDVCVIGETELIQAAPVFKGASTPTLSLALVEEKNPDRVAAHCHILFIGDVGAEAMADILRSVKGKPVLTVSDNEGFAERGGIIGFVMEENKVKLAVNTKSASEAGLRIDAQLLEIALKVIDR